jgi:hypothetical protein
MEEQKNNSNQNKMDWKPVLMFYAKTTSWIIIPLVLAMVISKKIAPSLYLIFILIGFGISCYGIYREIKDYKNKLDDK